MLNLARLSSVFAICMLSFPVLSFDTLHTRIAFSKNENKLIWVDVDGKVWRLNLKQKNSDAAEMFQIPEPIIALTGHSTHVLALGANGQVWSFGQNHFGQLGLPDRIERDTPTLIPTLHGIIAIGAGNGVSYALDSAGCVFAFGHNSVEISLGVPHAIFGAPSRVAEIPPIKSISVGQAHILALDYEGNIWSWGLNSVGQCGLGHVENIAPPSKIDVRARAKYISAFFNSSFFVDEDDRPWAFGHRYAHPLHLETYYSDPAVIPSFWVKGILGLHMGGMLMTVDGEIFAWMKETNESPKIAVLEGTVGRAIASMDRAIFVLGSDECVYVRGAIGNCNFPEFEKIDQILPGTFPLPLNHQMKSASKKCANGRCV